jgi:hypothetical protein
MIKLKLLLNEIMKFPFSKIKVYRGIKLNDVSDLDMNNLGVHFTAEPSVANSMDNWMTSLNKTGNELFIISAWIDVDDINFPATLNSNSDYPREYEIVMDKNVKLKIDVEDNYGEVVLSNASANTGTRQDGWVSEIGDNYTHSDYIEFLNSLHDWATVKK